MRRYLALLATLLGLLLPAVRPVAGAPGIVPAANLWLPNGPINAAAVSGDTLYLGGHFTTIGPAGGSLVALDPTAAAYDPAFPRVSGTVNALIADGAGGWFIGGQFGAVNNVPRSNLAHITADKALDLAWAPAVGGSLPVQARVLALALAGDRLYVGGQFEQINDTAISYLAAVSASGSGAVDPNWQPAPSGAIGANTTTVSALLVDGSRLYVGGSFAGIGGAARTNLARVTTTGVGTADPTWAPNPNNSIAAIALAGSRLYVGGFFTQIGGLSQPYLAAVSTAGAGSVDAAWRPTLNDGLRALVLDGSELYLGGFFTTVGGQPRSRAAAVSVATGEPTAWAPSVGGFWSGYVSVIAIRADGIYLGGSFSTVDAAKRTGLARVGRDGAVDGWNAMLDGDVNALVATERAVYVAGTMTTVNAVARSNLAAIDLRTGHATAWQPVANDGVYALAVSGDRIYAGGRFTAIDGVAREHLAAIGTAGAVDPVWSADVTGPTANYGVEISALLVDGERLFVGGSYGTIDGARRNGLAAIGTGGAGVVDPEWNPLVDGLAVLALLRNGDRLYVGGTFTAIGGQPRSNLAALSPSGAATAVASWQPDPNGSVRALAYGGERLYVGGDFTTLAGQPCGQLAALTPAGSLDSSWQAQITRGSGGYPSVRNLLLSGDALYAAGYFTMANGAPRVKLAAFDAGAGGLLDWAPSLLSDQAPPATLAIGANILIVGGWFDSAGAWPSHFLAGFGTVDVVTGAASTIGRRSAEVAGLASAYDSTAKVSVIWGLASGSYSHAAAATPNPVGTREQVAVGATLTGLRPGLTYFYRVVVTTDGGTSMGAERQLTTLPGTDVYLPLVSRTP